MDYGGFILFVLMALGLLAWLLVTIRLFQRDSPWCREALGALVGGIVLLAIFGRHLYQVYWLDEKLFGAAASGNVSEVRALLRAGANPNATWEDGTPVLYAAENAEVRELLLKAGAGN